MSYIHVSWELRSDIESVDAQGKMKIKRFLLSPLPPLIFGHPSKVEGDDGDGDGSSEEEDIEYFNPDYADIHRVISCDTPDSCHAMCHSVVDMDSMADDPNDTELDVLYYVKWRSLPYNECSWERWSDIKYYTHEVFAFWQRQHPPKLSSLVVKHPALQDYTRLVESPVYGALASSSPSPSTPTNTSSSSSSSSSEEKKDKKEDEEEGEVGLTMRDYQMEGVNWLLWNWWHKRPCILADEM
jgi:hypothetical protein